MVPFSLSFSLSLSVICDLSVIDDLSGLLSSLKPRIYHRKFVDKNGFAEARVDQTGWSQVFAPPRTDGPGNFGNNGQNGGRLFSTSKQILEAVLYPEAAEDWVELVRGSTAIAAVLQGTKGDNVTLPYPNLANPDLPSGSLAHAYCEVAYGCIRTPGTCSKDSFGKTACDFYDEMAWGLRDGQLGPILELPKALLGLRLHPDGIIHLYKSTMVHPAGTWLLDSGQETCYVVRDS